MMGAVEHRALRLQTVLALPQGVHATAAGCSPLADGEVEPFATGGMALLAPCRQPRLDRIEGADHHPMFDVDKPAPPVRLRRSAGPSSWRPSGKNSGRPPGANTPLPRGTTRGAIARGRGRLSLTQSRVLSGSLAVHPQWRDRSRRLIACCALLSPSWTPRNTADNSSRGHWVRGLSPSTSRVQALRCSAAATRHGKTVLGAISNTRAVARMPRPSARHASTHPLSSTDACWPWTRVPCVARQEPSQEIPWHGRPGPPLGGPLARTFPSPNPPR